jgi:hypothetical protein
MSVAALEAKIQAEIDARRASDAEKEKTEKETAEKETEAVQSQSWRRALVWALPLLLLLIIPAIISGDPIRIGFFVLCSITVFVAYRRSISRSKAAPSTKARKARKEPRLPPSDKRVPVALDQPFVVQLSAEPPMYTCDAFLTEAEVSE